MKFSTAIIAFCLLCSAQPTLAEIYLGVAPARFTVKAAANKARPTAAALSIGYQLSEHRFEISTVVANSDDQLNQLSIDVPSSVSLGYRYLLNPKSDVKFDILLGFSRLEIESEYPSVAAVTETFEGFSYGVGIEEQIGKLRELSLRFEYARLYSGEDLDVDIISLGVRYEF